MLASRLRNNLRGAPDTLSIPDRRAAEFHHLQVLSHQLIASFNDSLGDSFALAAESLSCSSKIGAIPSRASLYSTESTSACQLASTIFADTPTVPHCAFLSPEQISTRTRLAEPDRLLVMTRTL